MKILIKDVNKEGFLALLGKRVTLFCVNYNYTGLLVGVNELCVKLEDAAIVFETGAFDSKDWKDAQKLPKDWYVMVRNIESFGDLK